MLHGRSPPLCDPQLAVGAHKIVFRDPMKVGPNEWCGGVARQIGILGGDHSVPLRSRLRVMIREKASSIVRFLLRTRRPMTNVDPKSVFQSQNVAGRSR
jgi:hypothetical protein